METTNIYVLREPITNEIRYVGKTNSPKQRLKNHLNKLRDTNTHKRNWINKLRKDKLKPIFEIIDTVPIDEWQYWEKHYITKFKNEGCNLVNYTDGGDGLNFGNQTSFKEGHNIVSIVALEKDGTYFNTFKSITEACNILSISMGNISAVLSKKTKTAGNYIWLYESDYDNISKIELDNIIEFANDYSNKGSINTRFQNGHSAWNKGKNIKIKGDKHVFQYSAKTGEFIKEWNTAKEASLELKCNAEGIGQCARGTAKTAGGFKWKYKRFDKVIPVKYIGKTNNMIINKLK